MPERHCYSNHSAHSPEGSQNSTITFEERQNQVAQEYGLDPDQVVFRSPNKVTDKTVLYWGDLNFSLLADRFGGEVPPNLQKIVGDADFRDTSMTHLGSLKEIVGNADFRNSNIHPRSRLPEIEGSTTFDPSNVWEQVEQNLGKLRHFLLWKRWPPRR